MALNHRLDPVGGSPRFGSCQLRLRRHVLARTTFCYPDSPLQPRNFGIETAGALVALAEENCLDLDPVLDNYVEAHVHGVLHLREDVEAVVLDPSYRGTAVEEAVRELGTSVEWHAGFRLPAHRWRDCERLRGPEAAEALTRIAVHGVVTPAILGTARADGLVDRTAKRLWHCIVRYGQHGWRRARLLRSTRHHSVIALPQENQQFLRSTTLDDLHRDGAVHLREHHGGSASPEPQSARGIPVRDIRERDELTWAGAIGCRNGTVFGDVTTAAGGPPPRQARA